MSGVDQEQLQNLYDSPEGQLGPILFGGHLHWGYWDEASAGADFGSAAERLAQMMIAKTTIAAGERFIDLGCGVGHPALKLTRARGCHVDGITISKFQQQAATDKARAEGLQDRLRFFHGTALEIPAPDASYDGGWFFESIFHMGQREALREAARVLKPGATLVLTDLPTLPHTTDDFRAFVKEHIQSSFVTKESYPALLAEAGFELVGIDDITANVMPYLVPKFRETLAAHRQEIEDTVVGITEETIENWVFLFEYMSENLGYMIVTARRT
ncbi:MAG TPA: methyltransferase domain-containing protein [Ramlibacter sp.]|jgi:ubiquinone/menaquinone biosynthesis C-methylase UbiE